MIIDELSDTPIMVGGRLVSQQAFISNWESVHGISTPRDFDSLIPAEDVLTNAGLEGEKARAVFSQTLQLDNTQKAISQAFLNKVANVSGLSNFAGGTMSEFVPAISTMATNVMSFAMGDKSAAALAMMAIDTAVGAALQGIAKIPVVGPIIAAVLGVLYMIGKAIAQATTDKRDSRDKDSNDFFQNRRALQSISKELDDQRMNQVLDVIGTGDWTSLFLPAYDWNAEWIGVMRSTGFEYFPGDRDGGSWGEGVPLPGVYSRDGKFGIGFMPGTQQITDAIQSRMSDRDIGAAASFLKNTKTGSGKWRRTDTLWEYIITHAPKYLQRGDMANAGDYYASATQALTYFWGHMQMDGNPDLYRVDTAYMLGAWRRYAEGATDYFYRSCNWIKRDSIYKSFHEGSPREAIRDSQDKDIQRKYAEHVYSCAVGYFTSAYVGMPGNRKTRDGKLLYQWQSDVTAEGLGNPKVAGNPGTQLQYTNMYEAFLKSNITDLRTLQFESLSKTLVCAYVRGPENPNATTFGAFRGDANHALRKKLHHMRELLLKRPDQWRYLSRADVPREEIHNGANWYNQLEAAGAFKVAAKSPTSVLAQKIKGRDPKRSYDDGASLEPGPLPPPVIIGGRVPGMELAPPVKKKSGKGKSSSAVPLIIGAAALGIFMMNSKR